MKNYNNLLCGDLASCLFSPDPDQSPGSSKSVTKMIEAAKSAVDRSENKSDDFTDFDDVPSDDSDTSDSDHRSDLPALDVSFHLKIGDWDDCAISSSKLKKIIRDAMSQSVEELMSVSTLKNFELALPNKNQLVSVELSGILLTPKEPKYGFPWGQEPRLMSMSVSRGIQALQNIAFDAGVPLFVGKPTEKAVFLPFSKSLMDLPMWPSGSECFFKQREFRVGSSFDPSTRAVKAGRFSALTKPSYLMLVETLALLHLVRIRVGRGVSPSSTVRPKGFVYWSKSKKAWVSQAKKSRHKYSSAVDFGHVDFSVLKPFWKKVDEVFGTAQRLATSKDPQLSSYLFNIDDVSGDPEVELAARSFVIVAIIIGINGFNLYETFIHVDSGLPSPTLAGVEEFHVSPKFLERLGLMRNWE
jgi:hypothetical protein